MIRILLLTFVTIGMMLSSVVLVSWNKFPYQKSVENFAERLKYVAVKTRSGGSITDGMNLASFGSKYISSMFQKIDMISFDASSQMYDYNNADTAGLPGGYLAELSTGQIIIANGKGELSIWDIRKGFVSDVKSNLNQIYEMQDYKGKIIPGLFGRFGLRDLYRDELSNALYVSMFVDVTGDGCYGLGLLKAELSENPYDPVTFEQVFQTPECNSNFNGHASGGRIHRLNEKLILTVGSYDHNLYGDISIPQDPNSAVGKVISLNLKESPVPTFEVLSMGHRNQQGLEVVNDRIFITEHGPMGGDEVNIIADDLQHYGWPYFAYGYDYDYIAKFRMPHDYPYKKPLYYFSPSIGISEIIYYDKDLFKGFKNKFIIASLKDKALFLNDFDDEEYRIISSERIEIGHRIRDMILHSNGELVIATDDRKIIILTPSAASIETNESDFVKFPK